MRDWVYIGVAGMLGTWSRYAIHLLAKRTAVGAFGTLTVNILGCFMLTLLLEHPHMDRYLARSLRLSLAVGFMGAFTTFSTFGYETMQFFEQGHWYQAFLNILANLAGGLLAVWAGYRLSLALS